MADWAEAVAGRLPSTSCGKWLTTLLQSDRFNWNRLILRTNCIKLSNASFRIGYQVGTGNKLLQFVNHLATNSQRVGTAWHNKLFQLVWLRLAAVWFAESGSILSTTCYSLCVTGCVVNTGTSIVCFAFCIKVLLYLYNSNVIHIM